jgi:hypothetical protein
MSSIDLAATFSVARNPDPASKLAYLVRLPLPEGPLVLKAADSWPRTAKVYCHRGRGLARAARDRRPGPGTVLCTPWGGHRLGLARQQSP